MTQAAVEWLGMDLERPSKAEWYQMSVACEVRRVLSSRPQEHHIEDFRLVSAEGRSREDIEDEGATLEEQKRRDMAAFGKGGVYTPPPTREDAGDDPDPENSPDPEEYEEYTGRETSRWEDPLT